MFDDNTSCNSSFCRLQCVVIQLFFHNDKKWKKGNSKVFICFQENHIKLLPRNVTYFFIAKNTSSLNSGGLVIKSRNKEKLPGITADTKTYFVSPKYYLYKNAIQTKSQIYLLGLHVYNSTRVELYTQFSLLNIFGFHLSGYLTAEY